MNQYCLERIMVDTPDGKRFHGELWMSKSGKIVFVRRVDPDKDKMKIFNAYSLHPSIIHKLKTKKIDGISFLEKGNNKPMVIPTADLLMMLKGEIKDALGRFMVWEDEFKGGRTVYIKEIAFNEFYKKGREIIKE